MPPLPPPSAPSAAVSTLNVLSKQLRPRHNCDRSRPEFSGAKQAPTGSAADGAGKASRWGEGGGRAGEAKGEDGAKHSNPGVNCVASQTIE